jgi:putative tryptophan/tyrosine transport system substrate-binding protein
MLHRLLVAVVLALLGPPLCAAQPAAPIPRVGFLAASEPSPVGEAFRQGLRARGHIEDKNLAIYFKWADGRYDRLPDLAAELVSLNADLVVAVGREAALAAKQALGSTPIVMVGVDDPVGAGLVETLARPGRNVTGTSLLGSETTGRALQLLMEVAPRITRVAALWNPTSLAFQTQLRREAEAAAPGLGVQLQWVEVRNPNDLDRAFQTMVRQRAGALLVLPDPLFAFHRQRIVELAAKHRLPAMYGPREFVDAGGLACYTPNPAELARQAAATVDRILKGASPAELPVEPPARVDFVVNLKTAKALGLKPHESVLQHADEVVE